MDGDSPLFNVFDGKLKLRLYLFFVHPRPVHWFMRLLKTILTYTNEYENRQGSRVHAYVKKSKRSRNTVGCMFCFFLGRADFENFLNIKC